MAAVMDPVAVSRGRRLTRAVVYAVVVAVPLGMLAFLVRTKYDPLVTLDQDIIVAATGYTRDHPRFRSFVEAWEVISQPVVMYLLLGLPLFIGGWVLLAKRRSSDGRPSGLHRIIPA